MQFTKLVHHAGPFTAALLVWISLSKEKGVGNSMISLTFFLSTFEPSPWYQQNWRV